MSDVVFVTVDVNTIQYWPAGGRSSVEVTVVALHQRR